MRSSVDWPRALVARWNFNNDKCYGTGPRSVVIIFKSQCDNSWANSISNCSKLKTRAKIILWSSKKYMKSLKIQLTSRRIIIFCWSLIWEFAMLRVDINLQLCELPAFQKAKVCRCCRPWGLLHPKLFHRRRGTP